MTEEIIQSGPFAGQLRNNARVIYADVPWLFKAYDEETGNDRSAQRHYPCQSLEEITALPVADLAAKDCVLFFWVTDPFLFHAKPIIEAWGFKYKTIGFHWFKTNKDGEKFFTGQGFWTRANPELCLLCTRGSPKRLSKAVRRIIEGEDGSVQIVSRRREHSRKPDECYDRIEDLCGGPYTELYSRSTRPGWAKWGNEVGKFRAKAAPDVEDLL